MFWIAVTVYVLILLATPVALGYVAERYQDVNLNGMCIAGSAMGHTILILSLPVLDKYGLAAQLCFILAVSAISALVMLAIFVLPGIGKKLAKTRNSQDRNRS
jgi:hypothetical protein